VIKKQNLVIFLDSVDQLDKANNGRIVTSWIPKNLIQYVKVIISTIDQPEFGVFPEIKVRILYLICLKVVLCLLETASFYTLRIEIMMYNTEKQLIFIQ
jgi:hypothetical protein